MLKLDNLNLPLSLLLTINGNEQFKTIKTILKFYNLIDLDPNNKPLLVKQQIDLQTRNIIEHFNCIRFRPINKQQQQFNTNQFYKQQQQQQQHLIDSKIKIPNFSLILITNNSSKIVSNSNNNDEDYFNLDHSGWSYHHKVELNDSTGRSLARQLFFKLNNTNLPILFSRSNWHSPMQQHTQLKDTKNVKYIIRLNVNCKNFEMMLFFYRLLFSKCANYSKKDFSLFVLKKMVSIQDNSEFEYQLSLKQHDPTTTCFDNNNTSQSALVYKIDDRQQFDHICRLLAGYLIEQIKEKCYIVQDPDGNRIYLIDSNSTNISMTNALFNSIGLSEKYFSFNSNIWSIYNHSINNNSKLLNTNSSSSSFDSGNYSTLSSSSSSRNSFNQCCSSSSGSNRLNKPIKEYQEFMRHYKKLHKLISKEQNILDNEEAKINYGVKDLIKRFNQYQHENDYDNNYNNDDDDDAELKFLMKQAHIQQPSAQSIYRFNNYNKEINVDQYLKRHTNNKHRSRSVMAQPIISSSSLSSIASSMSSDSINIKTTTTSSSSSFDRKKSKSVTFLDSTGSNLSSGSSNISGSKYDRIKFKKANKKPNMMFRSKSTVPFSENYYLTADVDNEQEYYTLNDNDEFNRINYLSNEFHLTLNESAKENFRKEQDQQQQQQTKLQYDNISSKKPNIGITPETRFRRTPTLDIIRSTKMPNLVLPKNSLMEHYFNKKLPVAKF